MICCCWPKTGLLQIFIFQHWLEETRKLVISGLMKQQKYKLRLYVHHASYSWPFYVDKWYYHVIICPCVATGQLQAITINSFHQKPLVWRKLSFWGLTTRSKSQHQALRLKRQIFTFNMPALTLYPPSEAAQQASSECTIILNRVLCLTRPSPCTVAE